MDCDKLSTDGAACPTLMIKCLHIMPAFLKADAFIISNVKKLLLLKIFTILGISYQYPLSTMKPTIISFPVKINSECLSNLLNTNSYIKCRISIKVFRHGNF